MQAQWRPFFWEPVEGTGERLMAGVVLHFEGEWIARRMLRDDVLNCLFGKAAANPRNLIDEALQSCLVIAQIGGFEALSRMTEPLMGLYPGTPRTTEALSLGDAFRHAVLLNASLAQLDGWDELAEEDAPASEEVSKRFATEVRECVTAARPDLGRYFGRSTKLQPNGRPVRFGYLSDTAVLHFSVLHPVRQAASLRDARARLWELSRAKAVGGLQRAALITWVPSSSDPTVGKTQREGIELASTDILREADAVGMRFHSVMNSEEARDRLIAIAA